MKSIIFNFVSATLIAALFAASTSAQHSDVLLADVNGQVAIGAAEDLGGTPSFDLTTTTFETILVPGFSPVTPADYETEEPGFFGLNANDDAATLAGLGAAALPGNASVSASLTTFSIDGASSNLFHWDGTGAVNFTPAPAGTSFAFDPAANFATTGPNGDMDDHPIFELNATSGVPADGVYLVSPVADVDGLTTSRQFLLVMLADALIAGEDDAEAVEEAIEDLEEGIANDAVVDFGGGVMKDFAFFEEAVEYAEENAVIPEPSSLLLAALAMPLLGVRRKRAARGI